MKLTTFMITIILILVSVKGFGQITLNETNAPLEKVLVIIKKQTGYAILYDYDDIKNAKVSIQVSNASIDQTLSIILKDIPVTFKIFEKNIVLKKKEESLTHQVNSDIANLVDISGKVSDESGFLAHAIIRIRGTKIVTSTNSRGEFSLRRVNKNEVISFSYVGYRTKDVIITNIHVFNIILEQDNTALSQVVVVGYGNIKRKDLTGAVSTVNAQTVEDVPFATIDNALAGKAAGVEVTKSDGSPGGAVKIRIRGSTSILGGNDPLYVIDGIPIQVQSNFISPGYDVGSPIGNAITSTGGLNAGLSTSFVNGLNSLGGLNPDDIESITILKDASSTAIYGSKGANGVVIITTKQGKRDTKPVITASYYTTFTSPITPHVLNASQYKTLLTEAAQNDYDERNAAGDPIPDNVNSILNTPDLFFGTGNTNWIADVTRNTEAHNAEVAVQGGGPFSKYFTSITYNATPGVLDATDYQRTTGKINVENDIGKNFKFITNFLLGYTQQDIGDGAYGQALSARPDYTPYDANGNFTDFSPVGTPADGFLNPVALLTATNDAKTFSLLGTVACIYDIMSNLQFKSTLSLNYQAYNQRNYTPSYLDIGSFDGNVSNSGGIGGNSNSRLSDWFLENTLSYNKIFGSHRVDILAGQSYETREVSFFSATATGYPNDNVLTNLSSATTPLYVTGDDPTAPQSYLLSFYIRANYSYMDKYLLTFTGRTDGSSKFGPDNKFGYFPSGAIAWRISKENFLKNIKWIDDIKVRGSYGLTGTQNIGDQLYRTLYSPASYGGASALIPTQLGNSEIKWESTKEADAGLDISLFDGRLQTTLDYYNKQTSDALFALPIASSSSYTSLLSNSVGINNSGFEVSLSGDIIRSNDFKWRSSINVSWNRSLVTKLDNSADLSQLGDLTGLEYENTTLIQGKPLGLITGLTITGIIKTQAQLNAYKNQLGIPADVSPYLNIGDPMFKILNYTPDLNTIIAQAAPKFTGGITEGFTYKDFDLQFYFTFSGGGKLLWGDHVSSDEFSGVSNANVTILNRYTPTNTNTDQPRLLLDDDYYGRSNLDVFNSSYLKLRTLTLNYHFPKSKSMQRIGLQNASLFISATNLFTITKYPGNDPETSDDPYSVGGGYFDVSNYPAVRTMSLGIKAGF